MKRKLCIIAALAVTAVFSLSGCGSAESSATNAGSSETETEAEVLTEAVTEVPTEEVTEVPKNDEKMTLEEYNKIQNGMSYDEVVSIVGSPGTDTATSGAGGFTIRMVSWEGNGMLGSNANVTFTNGTVSGKAQFGLE